MTNSTRIFALTLLLGLTFLLAACGSAAPAAVSPDEEPAQTSPTAGAEDSATAQAPDATETSAPASEPAAAAGAVSFKNDILPIFDRTCARCHGGARREEGLDLRSYASIMEGSQNGAVIVPSDAEASELIKLVMSGKMPRRAPKLADEQIQLLADWVNQGALDN